MFEGASILEQIPLIGHKETVYKAVVLAVLLYGAET